MAAVKTTLPAAGTAKRSEARRVFQALEQFCADLQPGDKVPTHTELMRRFGASERMVLRALDELHRAGRIVRRMGSGTLIADAPASQRSLVTPDSRTVVAIAHPKGSFINRSLELLTRQAEHSGLSLLCRMLPEDCPPESLANTNLSGPLGYVVLGSDMMTLARHLRDAGHRVVLFGTPAVDTPIEVPCIHGDHEQGAYLATRHLLTLGHRRIAFVYRSEDVRHSYRWRGHQDALAEARTAGISVKDTLLTPKTYDAWFTDATLAAAYFEQPDAPTGLVLWNDTETISFLTVLQSVGLRVPDRVSLVGYDNLPEGSRVYPQLTTVDHGIERQMRLALKMLTQTETPPLTHVLVTPTLLARASSGAYHP